MTDEVLILKMFIHFIHLPKIIHTLITKIELLNKEQQWTSILSTYFFFLQNSQLHT